MLLCIDNSIVKNAVRLLGIEWDEWATGTDWIRTAMLTYMAASLQLAA